MDPIRLRGPADVLAALPYQLGYHPRDCLVLVALHDRAVGLVARIDLPAHEDTAAAAASALAPLLRERPDRVLLVGYESVEGASGPLLDEVERGLAAAGLGVLDRLVVRDGRWFSADCDEACCPDEGTPLPDPSETPGVADFVALGMAPLAERSALTTLVASDEGVCRDVASALQRQSGVSKALGVTVPEVRGEGVAGQGVAGQGVEDEMVVPLDRTRGRHDLAVRRLRWLSLWRVACDVGPGAVPVDRLQPDEVAGLVASLADVELRDGLIAWLCPGTMPLDALAEDLVDQLRCCLPDRPWHSQVSHGEAMLAGRRLLARLQWVARAVPDSHAAPILTVTANLAWWLGDGTVARVALERALEHAPEYRLARLLDHLVGLGVRPPSSRSR
jgi:hypothetical protein